MEEKGCVDKDYKKRMTIRTIALQLIDDCYKSKPSKESISDFLTRVYLLKERGGKC